jgi:hypothetical protein
MSITIIACWSLRPPSVISLDGPWHWAGLAMRLALQLGLHQEKTYSCLQNPNECRLVWWHLVVSSFYECNMFDTADWFSAVAFFFYLE